MIILRKAKHSDYNDVVEICKDNWEGTDYLPDLFYEWVDDKNGVFVCAVDETTGKVIGIDKYTILYDNSGWLEGLRVHKDYRGQGISKLLADYTIGLSLDDYKNAKTTSIGFSTHSSSKESLGLMKRYDFKLKQQYILITKEYKDFKNDKNNFYIEKWIPTYEEFVSFIYLKRRENILPLTFYFEKPTKILYEKLICDKCFISINGYKGLYKFKGEPHFIVFDECFEAIDTYVRYFSLINGENSPSPLTSIMENDTLLISKLKQNNYITFNEWKCDYLYFSNR